MNWTRNIKSITSTGVTSSCPGCGSANTEHEYVTIESPIGYLSIWCNDCGAKAVIDCLVPAESAKKTA